METDHTPPYVEDTRFMLQMSKEIIQSSKLTENKPSCSTRKEELETIVNIKSEPEQIEDVTQNPPQDKLDMMSYYEAKEEVEAYRYSLDEDTDEYITEEEQDNCLEQLDINCSSKQEHADEMSLKSEGSLKTESANMWENELDGNEARNPQEDSNRTKNSVAMDTNSSGSSGESEEGEEYPGMVIVNNEQMHINEEEEGPVDLSINSVAKQQFIENLSLKQQLSCAGDKQSYTIKNDNVTPEFPSQVEIKSRFEMLMWQTEENLKNSDITDSSNQKSEDGQTSELLNNNLSHSKKEDKKIKAKTKKILTGDKVFECSTCLKTFPRKSNWRHHIKTHINDKFKECKVCGKKIKFSGSMLSHMKTHSGERPFNCQYCDKSFTRAASLYTHVRSHTGEKAFLCEICGKGFSDKSHYRRHLKIHSGIKPFVCSVCGMGFTQSWSLKTHSLSHTEEKPHVCSVCGKGYTQKAYLESHFRSHTGERPYTCETCGKTFSDSSCMRRHVKSHLGEKSHICDHCGKAFARRWNLNVHLRIHYDDKRYECPECGKAFVQKINLDKHILTHNKL